MTIIDMSGWNAAELRPIMGCFEKAFSFVSDNYLQFRRNRPYRWLE